ncbi:MAG TPA: dehydrogenase [Cyanobacteria bacterium UBA8530]|nr:dehydrogenase [Cyanobacteria bacterium UBA8530]
MQPLSETIKILNARLESGEPCATATVIKTSGSIPTEVGAKMLVAPDGSLLAGTVGGGLLESVVLEAAGKSLKEGRSEIFSYTLTEEDAGGMGMVCGGNLQVFIEVFASQDQLVLVGGGHVNLALAKLAAPFGFHLAVVDDRPEWANESNFPGATLSLAPPSEAFKEIALNPSSFVVIATRGHRFDQEALEAALDHPSRYIGMIGSKKKVLEVLREIGGKRDLEKDLPRIFAPIGLDLGGKSPVAVALSILAEIAMVRNERQGGSLREFRKKLEA